MAFLTPCLDSALGKPYLKVFACAKCFPNRFMSFERHMWADQACADSLLAKKESPYFLSGKKGFQNWTEGYSFFLVFFSFMLSPIMLLAVKEATMLLSISLPACGEFGNKIKFALVCSPIDWSVS